MYIGSEIITGIAILIACLMVLIVIFGVIIISLLAGIKLSLNKFLKMYTAFHGK
jgi:hypothetical protein